MEVSMVIKQVLEVLDQDGPAPESGITARGRSRRMMNGNCAEGRNDAEATS